MRELPRPGDRYRHFKNKLYQIVAVATHSETGEKMVVYQALYGDFGVWVRPLSMFLEPVDRKKHPDAAQEYRFERVDQKKYPDAEDAQRENRMSVHRRAGKQEPPGIEKAQEETWFRNASASSQHRAQKQAEPALHPLFHQFLDADTFEERMELLARMRGQVGRREAESLCLCLDIQPVSGSVEEILDQIRQCLRMQQRYDAPRLRR